MKKKASQMNRSMTAQADSKGRKGTIPARVSRSNRVMKSEFTALNAMRQGVLLLDADRNVAFANKTFRRLWQLPDAVADSKPSYAELLEHGWNKGFYSNDAASMAATIAKHAALVDSAHGFGPVRIDLADGRTYLLESTPVPDNMRLITYSDATSLADTIKVAECVSQAKSDFLIGLSYQLRTPLNGIFGFLQMLVTELSETLNQRQKDYVQEIEIGGRHLLDLIDDIRSLARLEANQLSIKAETTALADIVADTETSVATLAKNHDIRIVWPDELETRKSVHVDPLRARQILVNLLSNAIKYNRPQGTVTIKIVETQSAVKVMVMDEGTGIPFDQQPRLFEIFNRLGMENSDIDGNGIGLVFSRKLAEAMKGWLGFTSIPGAGSCFWVEFPKPNEAHVLRQCTSLDASGWVN